MLSGFVDTYLRLEAPETEIFLRELDKIESREKEGVMEVVTSWMQEGIDRGREEERQESIKAFLAAKYGELTPELTAVIPALMKLDAGDRARLILQSSWEELKQALSR
jgi:hypothetical protein